MTRHLLHWPARRLAQAPPGLWPRRLVRCCGFTLIELLVTIAVLSILIGMLLPMVQQMRVERIAAATQNNLKQLDVALRDYEAANSVVPTHWFDILPYLDGSFALEGDSLLKDGHSFTLLGADAPDAALVVTSLTKVVKPGSVEKQGGKVRVEAKPLSPMVGTKTYLLDHKDGSIKSTEDPKLLAEQEKRMLEIRKEGTRHIISATKELIEDSPDATVVKELAEFPEVFKEGAFKLVADGDGKVSLDDLKKLAGDESLPPKDRQEVYARYFKQKMDIGIGNETTDGSNGATVDIEGLTLPPKDTLTWDVFRQLAADYLEEGVTREALLAISYAAEKTEFANPDSTAAQYDALRQQIDTLLLHGSLDIKEAAELRQFLDLRSDLLAPAP